MTMKGVDCEYLVSYAGPWADVQRDILLEVSFPGQTKTATAMAWPRPVQREEYHEEHDYGYHLFIINYWLAGC